MSADPGRTATEQRFLTEQQFSEMVAGALALNGKSIAIGKNLMNGLQNGGHGRLIAMPNGPARNLDKPTDNQLSVNLIDTNIVILNAITALLVVINDLDTRLRLKETVDRKEPAAVVLGHETVPSADSSQPEGTQGHQ